MKTNFENLVICRTISFILLLRFYSYRDTQITPKYSSMESKRRDILQGTNARKVIREVYTFFVLQCTVFGRIIYEKFWS